MGTVVDCCSEMVENEAKRMLPELNVKGSKQGPGRVPVGSAKSTPAAIAAARSELVVRDFVRLVPVPPNRKCALTEFAPVLLSRN